MALQKQNISINFAQGMDTKPDPKQVIPGKFIYLRNSVFDVGGLLTKRNGFASLPSLPDSTSIYCTTFNGDLTAIGTKVEAYSPGSMTWTNRGKIQPLSLSVLPLIRNNLNQSQCDSAVASNGLICTVYTENNAGTNTYKYVIANSETGQNVIAPTAISTADATLGTPRVFILGSYFIIIFTNKVTTVYHLKYFYINSMNPTNVGTPVDISTSYTPASTVAFDAAVFNNALYIAWNGAASSGLKMAYLTSNLVLSSAVNPDPSHESTMTSVTVDSVNGNVWVGYYNLATPKGYALAVDQNLNTVLSGTQVIASGTILNITSYASQGVFTLVYEVSNAYSYDSGVPTNYVQSVTCTSSGTVGSPGTVNRSVGLASKAFFVGSVPYFLLVYSSPFQNTYFLSDYNGNIIAKLAYGNGGGYLTAGLPSVTVAGAIAQMAYLFKDMVQAISTNTALPASSVTAGVYSQTGINLVSFDIGDPNISTAEIGSNLNISGGFVWAYDGYIPVEQGFFLYPDSVEITTATGSGGLIAQDYWYITTYEWSDNQGNQFRSAGSIPVKQTTTTGSSTNTVNVPTYRLTYKIANPVKIVLYRWSTAQQTFYQVTSITAPKLNTVAADSVSITDSSSDATIAGNNILYTTGGVLENIAPPATNAMTLFDDRFWLIDAENKNLLWFSKQVIQATPVEMSDQLTFYVAPTISAQGPTGDLQCLAAMDDKLILFKKDAIYYINGTGPDNTGLNSQYSQPIFITSSVGCSNQQSIVLMPNGLMFQSDKGIWLLGRDLSTRYIGAEVQAYNGTTIQGAVGVPATNQDRFTAQNGTALMYDYYYGQWGTFSNVPAVSSTIFESEHTYISSTGQVFQESPGTYLDGSNPVLMSFQTGWINLAGLQGYQRAYFFYLLGTYISPHKLTVQIAYDYNDSPIQQVIISPTNFAPAYGDDLTYGSGTPYGGPGNLEQWRIFFKQQRCQAFQLTVSESYDSSYGVVAGPGLSLSGINCVVGIKKGYTPMLASKSVG